MKSLFNTEAHAEILSRIDQLSESTQRQWGKMKVGQMLHHCQFPLKVALGKLTIKKPNPFMKLIYSGFKKSMYSDKLWKHNLPTAPGFVVSEPKEFVQEKEKLVSLVNDFYGEREKEVWGRHPAFGDLTNEQWGQMQYKHLDHHLRQFGV
jgi:hypothetical protein